LSTGIFIHQENPVATYYTIAGSVLYMLRRAKKTENIWRQTLRSQTWGLFVSDAIYSKTRSSAIAEGTRDASWNLVNCCTTV